MGRTDEGWDWFLSAHQRNPDSVQILLDWSDALMEQACQEQSQGAEDYERRYVEAKEKIQQAAQLDYWNTSPLRALGNLLLELEQPQQALDQFELALRLDPYDEFAYVGKGKSLRKLNRDVEAANAYERALVFQPNYRWLLTELGELFQRLERHNEAVIKLKQALEIDPRDARTSHLLADSLRKIGSAP